MAFSIEVSGLDELQKKFDELGAKALGIAARGVYDGAGIVADKVSQAVNGIATEPFRYAAGGKKRKPSPEEKALLAGAKHGIAKFKNTGTGVQTSVGYQNAGYGTLNGVTKPIPLIANSINHGTSFMERQPFLKKAFSQSNGAAAAKIESTILEEIEKLNID